jgi:hypothetical protein
MRGRPGPGRNREVRDRAGRHLAVVGGTLQR